MSHMWAKDPSVDSFLERAVSKSKMSMSLSEQRKTAPHSSGAENATTNEGLGFEGLGALPTLLSNSALSGKVSLSLSRRNHTEIKPKPPSRIPDCPAPPETPPDTLQKSLKALSGKSCSNSDKTAAWKSAAKMAGRIGVLTKGSAGSRPSTASAQQEPRVSDTELAELSKFESILLTDYQTVANAFHVVTADKACFTESDLRYALSQHRTQAEIMGGSLAAGNVKLGDVPQVFLSMCKVLKFPPGPIPKQIFLLLPDRLRWERLQRARFERSGQVRAEEAVVEGPRLLQLLSKGAKTPEAARKLLNQVIVAMQRQPQETAKALLRSTKKLGGENAGLRHIIKLMREHGAPVSGTGLDILISGWAVCGALSQSGIALGTLERSGSLHGFGSQSGRARKTRHKMMVKAVGALGTISSSIRLGRLRDKADASHDASHDEAQREGIHDARFQLGVTTRVAHFGTRLIRRLPGARRKHYHAKVGVSSEAIEEENPSNLWTLLPPGEVLHCVRLGSKTLDGEEFKYLLQAAWALFDECDAVSWMIEPKHDSDSRALQLLWVKEALAEVVTVSSHPGQLTQDAEPMHQQLVRSHAAVQQLKELCDGCDDGLMRRAALYGLPLLLERVTMWVHASVGQIENQTIGRPSRNAAHEMDNMVAKVLESFTPFEIAVEDGLGYQVPDHHEAFMTSRNNNSASAGVVCEEAWKRFLQSREDAQRAKQNAKNQESKEHALGTSGRFCTHKLMTHGFAARNA